MTMTKAQVIALLKENQNNRGIAHWKKRRAKTVQLESFGIGLTQLRKLAKQIGRDHTLAQQLWKSNLYDAKMIGLLIDDPKQLSREQAEEQVDELPGGLYAPGRERFNGSGDKGRCVRRRDRGGVSSTE